MVNGMNRTRIEWSRNSCFTARIPGNIHVLAKRIVSAIVVIAMAFSLFACGGQRNTVPDVTSISEETAAPVESTVAETICLPTESEPQETIPATEPEIIPEPAAQEITDGFQFLLNGYARQESLVDGNFYTSIWINTSDSFVVESEVPFSSLYLQWDYLPGVYTINWENGSLQCGQDGFLHEYVSLSEAVTAVEFVFPEGERKSLCELALYTEGSTPEGVQIWNQPCEQADILVFPTHSDDDTLFFGPLIAYYAIERQLKVQTAFMVEHTVQPYRVHERLNGLWEMGVKHYPILYNAPDTAEHDFWTAMSWYSMSKIPDWQVEQIRRFKPLVVVGHDLNGEYGNGGHKVNAYYLVRAIEYAADAEMYPESAEMYGVWDTPKLYIHLYPENEWYFDVNTPMMNDPEGRTPFEVAEDAFDWHRSQHQWGFRVQQNDDVRMYDCRPFGLYRSLVGEDTTADVMENIVPDDWRKEE